MWCVEISHVSSEGVVCRDISCIAFMNNTYVLPLLLVVEEYYTDVLQRPVVVLFLYVPL